MSRFDRIAKIVALITAVIGIPVALFSLHEKISNFFSDSTSSVVSEESDLVVSKLAKPVRIKPLDGYQVLQTSQKQDLYTGGFRVFFTLGHNNRGNQPIIITSLRLNLRKYEQLQLPEYDYRIDSKAIIGAGTTKPNVFLISMFGNKTGRAVKVVDGKSLTARSENMFDTDEPERLTLKPNSDIPEEVYITVLARENGLYELSFVFDYSVNGQDRVYESEPITTYYWEN